MDIGLSRFVFISSLLPDRRETARLAGFWKQWNITIHGVEVLLDEKVVWAVPRKNPDKLFLGNSSIVLLIDGNRRIIWARTKPSDEQLLKAVALADRWV